MAIVFATEVAHWHQFFENISVSTLDFYKSLEQALNENKVPDISMSRVDFFEGSVISAKRVYLKVRRDWLTYHICVAPFGTGFFVSSRLLFFPWGSWPIMLIIAGVLGFFLLVVFLIIAELDKSPVIAFVVTFFMALPTGFFFLIIFAVWIYFCLRMTYYRQDTMLAFHEAVHRLFVSAVNKVIEPTGRKPLSADESKPILHRLLRR